MLTWSDSQSDTQPASFDSIVPSNNFYTDSVPLPQVSLNQARPSTSSVNNASPPSGALSAASKSKSSSPPAERPNKVEKTFHFVSNSDKKTATRIRNTMASRKLRDSKVSKIAALEVELEKQIEEAKMWRERAVSMGWKDV